MLEGTRFLVTGATGRLGVELCRRLAELGAEVVPAVTAGYPDLPRRVAWQLAAPPRRLAAADELGGLEPVDHVVHLHWRVCRHGPFAAQLAWEVSHNLERLEPLWQWIRQHPPRTLVHASSIRVFSHRNGAGPLGAAADPRPATPYGVAKLAAERFLDAALPSAVAVVQARLCSVASVGEHPTQLMSRLCRSALDREPIIVNAGHRVSLMFIDDAVDLLIAAALRAEPGVLHLTAPFRANEEVARRFESVAGRSLEARYEDLAPGRIEPVVSSDVDRLLAPWMRRTPLDAMVERFVRGAADVARDNR